MRRFCRTSLTSLAAGLLLSTVMASAQMKRAPAPSPPPQQHQRVVVVPFRVYDPFFDYPYPYAYPPGYMAENFGYVKLDAKDKDKDDSVYVDGGFADKLDKVKNFALRPGNHNIEVRDSDGRPVLQQRVAVLVGKTTKLKVSG